MLTIVAAHFRWATDRDCRCVPYHHADVPYGTYPNWDAVYAALPALKAANPLLSFAVRPIKMDAPEVYACPQGLEPSED
jgi:hypothetical protein